MQETILNHLTAEPSATLATLATVACASPTATSFVLADLIRQNIVIRLRSPFRYALASQAVNHGR